VSLEQNRIKSLVELSVQNLNSNLKDALLCFSPFSGVINKDFLPQYIERLKEEPALAALPLDELDAALAEAEARSLVSADAQNPAFLRPQPAFGYFLANRLSDTALAETRAAIEAAFVDHMTGYADAIVRAIDSKQPDEHKAGLFLAGVEYGNLHRGLMLALAQGRPILACYKALSVYIDAQQDHQRGLELGETVRAALGRAPSAGLTVQQLGERAAVIDSIAKRLLLLRRLNDAEAAYQQALALADHPELPATWRASILGQLGIVAQEQRRFDEAAGYYRQSLDIALEHGDRHGAASTYRQLGRLAEEQHRLDEAASYCQQALDIALEYGDRHGAALIYHQLGRLAQAQHRFAEAADYYRLSLDIELEYGDRHGAALIYHQLGRLAQAQYRFAEAVGYYRQALDIKLQYGDRHGAASTYHQLGSVAEEQRRFDEAAGYYRQSLDIKLEYGDRHGAASTYGQLGNLMGRKGRHAESLDYYLSALPILAEAGDGGHLAGITLDNLALLWRAWGDDVVVARTAEVMGETPDAVRTFFEQAAPDDSTAP